MVYTVSHFLASSVIFRGAANRPQRLMEASISPRFEGRSEGLMEKKVMQNSGGLLGAGAVRSHGARSRRSCFCQSSQNSVDFNRPLSLIGEKRMLGRVAGAFLNS